MMDTALGSTRLARTFAVVLVALSALLVPAGALAAHARVIENYQNGQRVIQPNKLHPGAPGFPGYTDDRLERIVPDPKLRIAFEMALSNDNFRSQSGLFLNQEYSPGSRITRQSADPGHRGNAWAYTYPDRNWIVIGDDLYREPPAVIGAVIAHELSHAVADSGYNPNAGTGWDCFNNEMNAHVWGSETFVRTLMPMAYGPGEPLTPAGYQLVKQYEMSEQLTLRPWIEYAYGSNGNGQCA